MEPEKVCWISGQLPVELINGASARFNIADCNKHTVPVYASLITRCCTCWISQYIQNFILTSVSELYYIYS